MCFINSIVMHQINEKNSGGYNIEVTPVPIPNTEVKLYSADGTARATVWESRSLPDIIYEP